MLLALTLPAMAVLRLSAPRHRRSTTPSAGPADGQWGKLLAVEPHGLS
jgi:hypothetical protein